MHAFASLLFLVGLGMLFGKSRAPTVSVQSTRGKAKLGASLLAGAGVGLITGFLGVGGGFLVVPALIAFSGLQMREAVGTSLLVIAVNSAAGLLGHLGHAALDPGLTAALTGAAVVGALMGERLGRHVSTLKLRRGFGLVVIVVGITLLFAQGLGRHAA